MVRTHGPLLSVNATGTLAKTLIHSSCRGTPYTKRHVIPNDPKSPKQLARRATVKWLCNAWHHSTAAQKASWSPIALADNLPEYQAFLRYNLIRFRDNLPCTPLYPPDGLGPVPNYSNKYADAEVGRIKLQIQDNATQRYWAFTTHRNTTSTVTPSPDNIVVGDTMPGTWSTLYDNNVTPGTNYWYKWRFLNWQGQQYLTGTLGPVTPLP
jgi:hypothetical protein